MRVVSLVLVCSACVSHARIVQTASTEIQHKALDTSTTSFKALAALLLAVNMASASSGAGVIGRSLASVSTGSPLWRAGNRQGKVSMQESQLTKSEERVSAAMEIKPVSSESARASGLALALDDGTRKSHSMAENTQFVTGFFKGISTRGAFSKLVASLYFVYKAMEEAFDTSEDASVKALDYPELRRLQSLESDMAYYFGEDWRETVKPSLATKEYCDQISAIAREEPTLLIAHMYTRYLGDLFGGQMMGGMARKSLQLEQDLGTNFYDFKDIPDAKKFIEEWYAKLNSLPLSNEQQKRIVDEANDVFRLNIEIFNELEAGKGDLFKSIWRLSLGPQLQKLQFWKRTA